MHRLETMSKHDREEYEKLQKTNDHSVNAFAMYALKIDEICVVINEIQEALLEKGVMKLQ